MLFPLHPLFGKAFHLRHAGGLTLVARVHDKGLVNGHQLYLRRSVAPPVVIRLDAVTGRKKERELLG